MGAVGSGTFSRRSRSPPTRARHRAESLRKLSRRAVARPSIRSSSSTVVLFAREPIFFLPLFLPPFPAPFPLSLPPSRSASLFRSFPLAPYRVTYAQTVLLSFDDRFLAPFFSDHGTTTRVAGSSLQLVANFHASRLVISRSRSIQSNHSKYRCQPRGRLLRSIFLYLHYRGNETRNLLQASLLSINFIGERERERDRLTQVYSIFRTQNARVNFIPERAGNGS